MSVAQGALVAGTLDKILSGILTSPPDAPLSSLGCLSPANLDRVCEWNSTYSIQPVERCVHDVIADQVLERPDAEAICAWDGSLTYRELDVVAGRLADRLAELGVGPEILVPLCFEKSVRIPSVFFVSIQVEVEQWLTPWTEMDSDSNAGGSESRWGLCASRPNSST
jgi:hypothetical protein